MRTLLDAVIRLRSHSSESRPRHFSLIDFGSDMVKAVVVRREQRGARVLGYGLAPANGQGLSGGRAEIAALAAAADEALTAAEDQTESAGGDKVVPDDVLLCIPARLTCGECYTVRQTRLDPTTPITTRELKGVWERVESLARERLPYLGDDSVTWKPLAITPGATTIDGHQVTDPVGLKGRDLSLSAFGVAVWPSVLRATEAVAERLELALVDVIASPQALATLVPRREAILLNIGREGTSLSLIRQDALLATHWWPQGGAFFTQSLAQAFRCSLQEAETLKRAHSDGALSPDDEALVCASLSPPLTTWLGALIAALREMMTQQPTYHLSNSRWGDLLPGTVYLTGGGSLLPDISQALLSLKSGTSLNFRRSLEVESLGRAIGGRVPGRPALLDVPSYPLSDLLAPAMSLATCLE